MARPKPDVIKTTEEFEDSSLDIIPVAELWTLTYDGQPVVMRRRQYNIRGEIFKYPKSVYPTEAVARNQATKLNQLFETDRFGAQNLMDYEPINTHGVN